MFLRSVVIAAVLCVGLPVSAQSTDETLADIRQQLTILYVELQRLRTELSTTGGASSTSGTGSPLERLDSIQSEVERLTSKTEALELRINRITVDGTNRVGDLEFRLCELEPNCDIASLGETPSLGGVDSAAEVPQPLPTVESSGPALAVGEQADFDAARTALEQGYLEGAAMAFADFVEAYPGGPLTAQADYFRGEALEALGRLTDAARAYLASFSVDPSGDVAPDALFKLGFMLGEIGQAQDACLTLSEVEVRFPNHPAVVDARAVMQVLGCQ